jgi:hypothetical protein
MLVFVIMLSSISIVGYVAIAVSNNIGTMAREYKKQVIGEAAAKCLENAEIVDQMAASAQKEKVTGNAERTVKAYATKLLIGTAIFGIAVLYLAACVIVRVVVLPVRVQESGS